MTPEERNAHKKDLSQFLEAAKKQGQIESYDVTVAEDGETTVTFVLPEPMKFIKLKVEI